MVKAIGIPVRGAQGTHSRQAHADMPAGTYEREMSKEGFFGPAAFFHHRRPPTGWMQVRGAVAAARLRPERLNAAAGLALGRAGRAAQRRLRDPVLEARPGRMPRAGPQRRRRPAAVRPRGRAAISSATTAGSAYEPGDYLYLPRGTMWRLASASATAVLMIQATNAHFGLPDKGLLGGHALFDPAMLDTPRWTRPSAPTRRPPAPIRCRSRSAAQVSRGDLPLQSARRGRLARRPRARAAQRERPSAGDQPPLPPAAERPHDLRLRPLRGLHLRAAAVRDRSRAR